MPLSNVQKGAIGQFAFLAAALATGNGQVEVYTPAADNEGRDAEVRRHLKRSPGVGVQVKVAFVTVRRDRSNQVYLEIRFDIPEGRVQNDPRLWYFLALYDRRQLRLLDPVFLVPSQVFHKMARRGKWKGRITFAMLANLGPDAHDRWAAYRVALSDLGNRLLQIVDEAPLTATSRSEKLPPDSILLGRAA